MRITDYQLTITKQKTTMKDLVKVFAVLLAALSCPSCDKDFVPAVEEGKPCVLDVCVGGALEASVGTRAGSGNADEKISSVQIMVFNTGTGQLDGALYKFTNGWSCLKFNNAPHDRNPLYWGEEAASKAYSDIDFPLIRLGEIYLIYAEACLRTHSTDDAIPYLQDLAERAGVEGPVSSYTEDWILQERARELYWEGHRRTDLIRFGKFHSGDFLWPYKGGDSFNGQSFERYKTLFALPLTDITANGTLDQNPGYIQTEK